MVADRIVPKKKIITVKKTRCPLCLNYIVKELKEVDDNNIFWCETCRVSIQVIDKPTLKRVQKFYHI